jgi:hypothetical protein
MASAPEGARRAATMDRMGNRGRAVLTAVLSAGRRREMIRRACRRTPLDGGGDDSVLTIPRASVMDVVAVREMIDAGRAMDRVGVDGRVSRRGGRATHETQGGDGEREAQREAHRRAPASCYRT